jgi:hypothetical protein
MISAQDSFAEQMRCHRRGGGQSRSAAKVAAARENGKRGGRPSLKRAETQVREQLGLSENEPITWPDIKNCLDGMKSAFDHLEEASKARKLSDEHEHNRVEAVTKAAKEIIETGYRLSALKYHPDRVVGQEDAMVNLNAAVIWLRGFVQ